MPAESVKNMLGEQFRMGRRMVPSEPELFRLLYDSLSGFYQDMDDGSYWQKTTLFDFGWGDEPGYYRYPMPTMQELLQLLLTATVEDDYFGAASVLLQDDAEEVLPLLESALQNKERYPRAAQRMKAVGLDRAINRSNIIGKSTAQVQADFARWQTLADAIISKTKQEKTNWWSRLFHKK